MDKDLAELKRFSLKHRLSMARNYSNPSKYLSEDEMPLYEQELQEYEKRFDHLDKDGPYRPVSLDNRYYIVGHGEVSHPVYDVESAMKLLLQKEQALKSD